MCGSDQHRHQNVGSSLLDSCNGRTKLGNVQREEVRGDYRGAVIFSIFFRLVALNSRRIVVSTNEINLLAVCLYGPLKRLLHLHRWRATEEENILIAHTALILLRADQQSFVLVDNRADDLA